MYPEIRHFITTFYTKKSVESLSLIIGQTNQEQLNAWNKEHVTLLNMLQQQLDVLYPNATLHVITDFDSPEQPGVINHKFPHEENHFAKLYMYGLLNEPAVYLDTDIIMFRKFEEKELPKDNPFNLYWHSNMNLQEFTNTPLPIEAKKIYNAGLAYIDQPSEKITEEMFKIRHTYFHPINQRIISENPKKYYMASDATIVSYYIAEKRITMSPSSVVNIQRSLCPKDFHKKQSVHYTRFFAEHRMLIFQDFSLSPAAKLHEIKSNIS